MAYEYMNRKKIVFFLALTLFLCPGLLQAQFRKSTFLLGANYYNDDPQGVIGDASTITGNVPGINANISYRSSLSRTLFYRIGAGLDIGGAKKVKDTSSDTEYTFEHSRIEIPFLIGFSLPSGPGHTYGAVGVQFVNYTAKLKTEGGVGSGAETDYSLSEVGSAYFVYGMEAPVSGRTNGFLEIQYSKAAGIGERKDASGTENVQLRPSYIRWNVGINYSF